MATKKDKEKVPKPVRTAEMKAAVDAILEKFDDSKILSRQGKGNTVFKYVKAQEYVLRLIDVFGLAWSCEIVQHFLVNNQVVVWVRIHFPNPDDYEQIFFRDGIDGHPLSGDVGNSFKAAYLKAFRKAAAQIGAGLHLWGVETDEEDDAPVWDQGPAVVTPLPVPNAAPPIPNGMPPVPAPPAIPQQGAPPVPNFPPNYAQQPAQVPPQAPPRPNLENNSAVPPLPPPPNHSAPPPPPPVPTGNPVAHGSGTTPIGPEGHPIGPAAASVTVNSSGGGGIQDFQINGIRGAAVTRGVDPMQLVGQVLGDRANGISAVEQLTMEQANEVLHTVRQMPPA